MPEWITHYWVEWLFGVVVAVIAAGYKRLSNQFTPDEMLDGYPVDRLMHDIALLYF